MSITETKRLRLDKAKSDDAAFFFQLMNSHNWIKYIGDREIYSEKSAADHIENKLIRSYNENGYGLYKMTLKANDIAIGICGFVKRDYLEHADLGFAVLPEYERKGYAYEAARAVLEYGTKVLLLEPILAITSPDNLVSQKLLAKLNFKASGTVSAPNCIEELQLFSNKTLNC